MGQISESTFQGRYNAKWESELRIKVKLIHDKDCKLQLIYYGKMGYTTTVLMQFTYKAIKNGIYEVLRFNHIWEIDADYIADVVNTILMWLNTQVFGEIDNPKWTLRYGEKKKY